MKKIMGVEINSVSEEFAREKKRCAKYDVVKFVVMLAVALSLTGVAIVAYVLLHPGAINPVVLWPVSSAAIVLEVLVAGQLCRRKQSGVRD